MRLTSIEFVMPRFGEGETKMKTTIAIELQPFYCSSFVGEIGNREDGMQEVSKN